MEIMTRFTYQLIYLANVLIKWWVYWSWLHYVLKCYIFGLLFEENAHTYGKELPMVCLKVLYKIATGAPQLTIPAIFQLATLQHLPPPNDDVTIQKVYKNEIWKRRNISFFSSKTKNCAENFPYLLRYFLAFVYTYFILFKIRTKFFYYSFKAISIHDFSFPFLTVLLFFFFMILQKAKLHLVRIRSTFLLGQTSFFSGDPLSLNTETLQIIELNWYIKHSHLLYWWHL